MTSEHQQPREFRGLIRAFELPGELLRVDPFGSGHINDTFCVTSRLMDDEAHYILQRINHHVFGDPIVVMENIQHVTTHIRLNLKGSADIDRRVLTVIPTNDAGLLHQDATGNYWRMFRFIENTRTCNVLESPAQAYKAARAFGEFQNQLTDLPLSRLHETIQDFHHTRKRLSALEQAIAEDALNRAQAARSEIVLAQNHRALADALLDAGLPKRVTHNDTKLNNVLFDATTGEALCVIDLDTVMPGLALYDFGDLVRSCATSAREDEPDITKVHLDLPVFEALARGYLSTAGHFLTRAERELLAVSAMVITFELGMRFLTDFLTGDKYFKIHRASHNLDRSRAQFALLESMLQQEAAMNRVVQSI